MYSPDDGRTMVIDHSRSQAASLFLAKVFNWMAIGLALTGFTALLVASSAAFSRPFSATRSCFMA